MSKVGSDRLCCGLKEGLRECHDTHDMKTVFESCALFVSLPFYTIPPFKNSWEFSLTCMILRDLSCIPIIMQSFTIVFCLVIEICQSKTEIAIFTIICVNTFFDHTNRTIMCHKSDLTPNESET